MAEGALILHGRVSTFFEKQQAQEAIRGIEGVRRIVNEVTVGSPESS
jgi:osmotically-inducible protein OsmY